MTKLFICRIIVNSTEFTTSSLCFKLQVIPSFWFYILVHFTFKSWILKPFLLGNRIFDILVWKLVLAYLFIAQLYAGRRGVRWLWQLSWIVWRQSGRSDRPPWRQTSSRSPSPAPRPFSSFVPLWIAAPWGWNEGLCENTRSSSCLLLLSADWNC